MRGRRIAHFLHVGKNAGSALKRGLRDAPQGTHFDVALHPHGVRMMDLPRGDKFFFVVRDPIDRFLSGFSSRQRQGAPRFHQAWTEGEARAFSRFLDPNALGSALASEGAERDAAIDALRSIEHVRTSYWDWFGNPSTFLRRERNVLWIGFVETLDAQLPNLANRLGLDEISLPSDDKLAHRSSSQPHPLEAPARNALAAWYARDYEFIALCREMARRL